MNNTNNPLVSIITPTYNHEPYIVECIQSVQAQSYVNWEMIIIDDESIDRTYELAKNHILKDGRIKLIKQKHKGIFNLAETYNYALKISKGKYVAILEGDDIWMPQKLEDQLKVVENDENIVVAWSRAHAVSPDSSKIYLTFPYEKDVNVRLFNNNPVGSFLEILLFIDPIPAVTLLIRRSAILSIGGFKTVPDFPTVDHPVLLELSTCGTFFYHDKVLAAWRSYANQTTKTYPVALWKGKWKMAVNFYSLLDQQIKRNLPLNMAEINSYYKKRLPIAYARSGRYKLIRKDFKGAQKDYFKAIIDKDFFTAPVWKLRAVIGLIFSLFHADVEGLAKFLGKISYK